MCLFIIFLSYVVIFEGDLKSWMERESKKRSLGLSHPMWKIDSPVNELLVEVCDKISFSF